MRSMTGVVADDYPPRSHVFVLLYKCVINLVVEQEVDKASYRLYKLSADIAM